VSSRYAPICKKPEEVKHVSFPDSQDPGGQISRKQTKSEVARAYETILGKTPKFIAENSPIDRYYKMYVVEPESKVWGGLSPRAAGGNTKLRHLRGCPNGISRATLSPAAAARRGKLKLPSPER
jgi:hypothetical protein